MVLNLETSLGILLHSQGSLVFQLLLAECIGFIIDITFLSHVTRESVSTAIAAVESFRKCNVQGPD